MVECFLGSTPQISKPQACNPVPHGLRRDNVSAICHMRAAVGLLARK
jgi:hypothetical protein